jgi:hypothetical protein
MKRFAIAAAAAVVGVNLGIAAATPTNYTGCDVDRAQNVAAGYPETTGPYVMCLLNPPPNPPVATNAYSMDATLNSANFSSCAHVINFADGSIHRSPLAMRSGSASLQAGCDWVPIGSILNKAGANRLFRCQRPSGSTEKPTFVQMEYARRSGACLVNTYAMASHSP